jgi:hypothetical protein
MSNESYEGDSMSDIDTTNKVLSFVVGYYDRNKHIPKLVGNLVNNQILANVETGILLIEWLEANRPEILQALIRLEENVDETADDVSPGDDHPGSHSPVFSHIEISDPISYEKMFS